MKTIRFTKEGYKNLKEEYEKLLKERPIAVEHLKKAREMGDLSENGYYRASRAKLSEIDRLLKKISFSMRNAKIINDTNKNKVTVGSNVILENNNKKSTYQIVGDLEANPAQRKISLQSPLGKALENKKAGDEIETNTPNGEIIYKLVRIY